MTKISWTFADTIGILINASLVMGIISYIISYQTMKQYCKNLGQEPQKKTDYWLHLVLFLLIVGFLYNRTYYRLNFFRQ